MWIISTSAFSFLHLAARMHFGAVRKEILWFNADSKRLNWITSFMNSFTKQQQKLLDVMQNECLTAAIKTLCNWRVTVKTQHNYHQNTTLSSSFLCATLSPLSTDPDGVWSDSRGNFQASRRHKPGNCHWAPTTFPCYTVTVTSFTQ